ncbi:phosphatase PAP2 family protein [uncultured Bradyrhizobium sp.]|jgi:hypothetical protein|uniref:phosphatase PAP2 family protein n=1 Tax=uncultured Bradyrhizobium sp. TaxID=199684 RepID=UPI00261CF2BC|nr:phosphatase PAP2 family protein [uncultured Bradyrhizobium sp.]
MFSALTCVRAAESPNRIGLSEELHKADLNALGNSGTFHRWTERCCWLIGIAACSVAAFLILALGVGIETDSLGASIALTAFFIFIYVFYGRYRPAPILSNISGAVAVLFLSIGMAGIMSLAGLRCRFPLIDGTLAEMDRFLAIDLPSTMVWFADHPALSNLLWIAYASSFVQLFGLVVLLAVLRREDKLWELVFVCSLTIVVAAAFSIVWPAIGAFAHFDYSPDILEKLPPGSGTYHLAKFDYFRNASSPVISFTSLQGVVTFPSFHCCLALMTIFAAAGIRWLFWTLTAWNALVLISTVPIGGHYVIDLAGGGLLWLIGVALAIALGRSARRRTPPRRLQIISEVNA